MISPVTPFAYSDLFSGERLDVNILLRTIPSRYVIGAMAMVNDILTIKGRSPATQMFILEALTVNIPADSRIPLLSRAATKMRSGDEMFAYPYTLAMINRELTDFREGRSTEQEDYGADELNMLKGYLSIMDEMVTNETEKLMPVIKKVREGGDPLELLWPNMLPQFEFMNRPDLILESYKGLALVSYLEHHDTFGPPIRQYFTSFGCKTGKEYLFQLLSLISSHIKRENSSRPQDYILMINTHQFEPVLSALALNPQVFKDDNTRQLDNRGLKETPLFQFDERRYVVPFWDYLYTALSTGMIFSLFKNSGVKELYKSAGKQEGNSKGFGNFKSTIGKEFSEGIFFKNTMITCFDKAPDTLRFFEDREEFSPDAYYRQDNHIFIIEYKDYLLNASVIQSGSYESIKAAIDEKFVVSTGKNKKKDKGINQLARNIEVLADNEELFYEIDNEAKRRKRKLKTMKIHPVIVQTSIHFDIPGINEYLDKLIQERLEKVKQVFRTIEPFTMIYFGYFYDKLLLYKDEKIRLTDELDYYHRTIRQSRGKVRKDRTIENWLNALTPFSFLHSPAYRNHFNYRRNELLPALKLCWQIDNPD